MDERTTSRKMEPNICDVRKQFQEIADSGIPARTSTLLRKAVVRCKKNEGSFNHEQLKRVVSIFMGNAPYILFQPRNLTKDYVIVLFWSTSIDDCNCKIQEQAEVIKKDVSLDDFKLIFRVETMLHPKRQLYYLLNKMDMLALQNDDLERLPAADHKQLNSILKLIREKKASESNKKRKTEDPLQKLFEDFVQ